MNQNHDLDSYKEYTGRLEQENAAMRRQISKLCDELHDLYIDHLRLVLDDLSRKLDAVIKIKQDN